LFEDVGGKVTGFALVGGAVAEKLSLAAQMPAWR